MTTISYTSPFVIDQGCKIGKMELQENLTVGGSGIRCERSEQRDRPSEARELSAGGFGGGRCKPPPTGARGRAPENFEILMLLNTQIPPFQHNFDR